MEQLISPHSTAINTTKFDGGKRFIITVEELISPHTTAINAIKFDGEKIYNNSGTTHLTSYYCH